MGPSEEDEKEGRQGTFSGPTPRHNVSLPGGQGCPGMPRWEDPLFLNSSLSLV